MTRLVYLGRSCHAACATYNCSLAFQVGFPVQVCCLNIEPATQAAAVDHDQVCGALHVLLQAYDISGLPERDAGNADQTVMTQREASLFPQLTGEQNRDRFQTVASQQPRRVLAMGPLCTPDVGSTLLKHPALRAV